MTFSFNFFGLFVSIFLTDTVMFKSNEKPLCESEIRIIISYKTKSDEFPLYLAAKENSKEFFKEKLEYPIRKENKFL